MKTRLILVICLILTFLTACGQVSIPTPTATPTAIPTNTPAPTATPTPTSTPTPIPTATRELTLEEKFGHLVPIDEKVVLAKAGEFSIGDPQIPSGTKYTEMQFRATGESRREQTSLGEVATVHLVFRDNDGVLQDVWMIFAGYSFGVNKDGINVTQGDQFRVGTPDELLKFVCPGTYFEVTVAWQKGTRKNIPEQCASDPRWRGACNELRQEAYRRIADDSEALKRLVEGNGVESSNFRLVPFYLSVRHGVPAPSTNGLGWEFEVEGNTEGCTEGWTGGNQITSLQIRQGYLTAQSTGDDPYIFSPVIQSPGRLGSGIDAEAFPTIEIRMKVSLGETAQLFFIVMATHPDYIQDFTFDEAKSLPFSITGDGQFHTYTLDMTKEMKWSGGIYQLRLDPTDTQAMIEIDYIRLKGP
ncbi:MAG TPA: hypothetical protein VI753_14290 [Anaerolineales bacterium]|nr:hypothetical protein [Anaerolineales bacterium]